MNKQPIIAVLGAGSWGTALAHLAAGKNLTTRLWARDKKTVQGLTKVKENVKYLPGIALQGIDFTDSLVQAVEGADWIVVAVPCAGIATLAEEVSELLAPQARIVSGSKGLEAETGLRPAQLWHQHAKLEPARYVALSGPNLAKEIAAGVPSSTVVASSDEVTAQSAQELFGTPTFRVYTNTDLVGVELGGALKNVVAIAAGLCDGLGFGDNSKGALMARAWSEMTRLAVALGARESTLSGLSGMGDLFATCISRHSRNHQLGCFLAGGESLKEAQRDVAQVAEGVYTTRAALKLAQQAGVDLPITEQVAAVLFEHCAPRQAVLELMGRQERSE